MADKNIYQKMLAITEEITKVAKNLNVGFKQNSYKAVGEADILAAVKPIEVKNGIYSYPKEREIVKQEEYTVEKEYRGEKKESLNVFVRIKTIYAFVNVDNPGEQIEVISYGDGVDSQDKAPGKAMTYSDKYALMKAYKIETGDDPDQEMSGSMSKGKQKITSTQYQALTNSAMEVDADVEALCGILGVKTFADLTAEGLVKANNLIERKRAKIAKEKAQEKPKEIDVAKMGEPVGKPDKLNAYDELKNASELNNVKL